jgi:branched-chain amino acid transport system substrate-binding protein
MLFRFLGLFFAILLASTPLSWAQTPVLIGLDAEFGLVNSTSAQAVERGIRIALHEINKSGGVLGGRKIELVTTDNRSLPARAIQNVRDLAAKPELIAIFCARYSPVAMESVPVIHEMKVIFLNPWASADGIIDNGMKPNYAFRLSLRDSLAMPFLIGQAEKRGHKKIGLLLANTSWGRSNQAQAEKYFDGNRRISLAGTSWYNWGDKSLIDKYEALRNSGAQSIIFIANDAEGAILAREVAALPQEQRLPILSHWGVTGGLFAQSVGEDLDKIDFATLQTYSFLAPSDKAMAERVLAVGKELFGWKNFADIASPVGVAHAYDLTHILAMAIEKAGVMDRAKIRDAMENLGEYKGLVRHLNPPFTAERHEALTPTELLLARFRKDGAIIPVELK